MATRHVIFRIHKECSTDKLLLHFNAQFQVLITRGKWKPIVSCYYKSFRLNLMKTHGLGWFPSRMLRWTCIQRMWILEACAGVNNIYPYILWCELGGLSAVSLALDSVFFSFKNLCDAFLQQMITYHFICLIFCLPTTIILKSSSSLRRYVCVSISAEPLKGQGRVWKIEFFLSLPYPTLTSSRSMSKSTEGQNKKSVKK